MQGDMAYASPSLREICYRPPRGEPYHSGDNERTSRTANDSSTFPISPGRDSIVRLRCVFADRNARSTAHVLFISPHQQVTNLAALALPPVQPRPYVRNDRAWIARLGPEPTDA